ncbi:MFS transporter [Phytomonospora endophytica]|uniref:MFS family permease n=1 Tax=Phytomonospora endophytica TaxID=714109 RepID=A0A841FKY7_9ACTN|nr:MFS transporter [Phytomonospora endophytica]MBB6038001.1 MFS family permease [Phytomonospora endophytica]GIG68900.1 MFS transporter [Phytomonospora endophytica]
MSVDVRHRPTPADRKARIAVAALFLTNGALFANLVPRLPQIKADLALDNAAYGMVVAAFPAGAIVVGLTAATLIRRFGSAPLAVTSTLLTGTALWAAVTVPSALALAVLLFLAGAVDSVTDVAQNAHGLRVQRRYGRSIINSFHALWSVGAVTGGSMAAAAIALDLPLGVHMGIVAALCGLVALIALRFCLPGRDDAPDDSGRTLAPEPKRGPVGVRTALLLTALVLIAIGGTVVEDAGSSWATLYLSTELGAPAALAATGFIALVGAQFVGRLLGDRLVDRFGQRTVARAGGLLVAAGMGLALAFPTVPGTILGFAASGLGVATLVPAAMHEADEIPGLRTGTGLTLVSWLMRLGFLLSPPLVGLVADAAGLRVGLLVVPLAGVLVIGLSGVLQARRR